MTPQPSHRPRKADAGSVTLELAILTPAVLVLLGLVILAGRIQVADQAVDHAAQTAARAATLARDPATARTRALEAATRELTTGDLHCTNVHLTLDTTGFAVPVGQAAQVTATVTCTLNVSGLGVLGVAATRVVTASAASALDTYRTRS